jgi:hypothetical protein
LDISIMSEPRRTAPDHTAAAHFVVHEGWGRLPPGWSFVEVAGVATDADDSVYVFSRGEHPVIVFDRDGRFLRSWGEGLFARPHGITIGPEGLVYCVDDLGHVIHKFRPDGERVGTLGTGQASDTGATSMDFRTILRASGPFHYPTNIAFGPTGDAFVSDGYGNARIHRFSAEGQLMQSWGEPGSGPGQFCIPHGIAVGNDGTVYVADRENSRLQLFSAQGALYTEWTDVARPCQVAIGPDGLVYVAELGFRAGMWPGIEPPYADATGGRMSVFDTDGNLKARWGGGRTPCAWGDFFAPHDVAVDSRGDLYVGEVTMSAGGRDGMVPADCHSLQKFSRTPRP